MRMGLMACLLMAMAGAARAESPLKPPFAWELSPPLVGPEKREVDASVAMKDPSIVFHEGKWHLWATTKCPTYTGMEYLSFDRWENADSAARHTIKMHDKYACAPQVFYFRPQRKWYMIYQRSGYTERGLKMQVVFSITANIADPASWTQPQPLFPDKDPVNVKAWLDFWVICDEANAYLFFTSLDGRMWRMAAPIGEFPHGFRNVQVAIQGDIFEASHTYRLKGTNQYLTLVEAQGKNAIRYYKAYVADRLDGKWIPLADSEANPFAGLANIRPAKGTPLWTDNVSHGELLRDSNDETLTVDPDHLQFLIQGCLQSEKGGKAYGQFPWRLGMLTLVKPGRPTNP